MPMAKSPLPLIFESLLTASPSFAYLLLEWNPNVTNAEGSIEIPMNVPKSTALVPKGNPSDNKEVTSRYEGRTHERERKDIMPPTKKALGGDVALSRILLLFSLRGLLGNIFTYSRDDAIL
ncbi:hypothetical protein [Pyrococcus furiosus]|nr:hypothetical protein [Pyrococcus furiosus]